MAGIENTQGDRIDRSTWIALIAMALGVFVIANDFTALSVAIPTGMAVSANGTRLPTLSGSGKS